MQLTPISHARRRRLPVSGCIRALESACLLKIATLQVCLAAAFLLIPATVQAQIRQPLPSVEYIPVGRLETRNYQHLAYGLAAFSSQAGLGHSLDSIKRQAAALLCVPNLDGITLNAPLTIHYLIPKAGAAANDSAVAIQRVAIVTLEDNGALLFDMLRTIYAEFTQYPWGVTFTHLNSGYDWPYPQVTVSLRNNRAFLSITPQAVEWLATAGNVLQLGQSTSDPLSSSFIPETLTALLRTVLPQEDAARSTPVMHLFARLIAASLPDLHAVDFAAKADGISLTLTGALRPAPSVQSTATASSTKLTAIELACAAAIPVNAVYASAEADPSTHGDWLSNVFGGVSAGLPTLKRLVDAPATAQVTYIEPSTKGQSLIYVCILETDDPASQLPDIVQKLSHAHLGAGLGYRPQPDRQSGKNRIRVFHMERAPAARDQPPSAAPSATISAETLPLLLALAAGGLTCELTATDRYLVLALGSAGVIDDVLPALAVARPAPALVRARWQPAGIRIPDNAQSVTVLYPVRLFRQLVNILPGSRSDLVRRIPTLGDGMLAFRTPIGEDGNFQSVLRIAANELNSLQLAFEHGQPIIQELLLNRAIQSMINKPLAPNTDNVLNPGRDPSLPE
ncbi:MAG: hypothetical protein FJ222_02050 [Lentisphaerae bacterium]|nr:hypothetical protein [Lentisphaerota bacterium]